MHVDDEEQIKLSLPKPVFKRPKCRKRVYHLTQLKIDFCDNKVASH